MGFNSGFKGLTPVIN